MLDLQKLEAQRDRLYRELPTIGDFRRGSISATYRRCGKPNCACSQSDHPGHGPQYLLTTKVEGRSRAKNLRPGVELRKAEKEVSNHCRFRAWVQRIVETSEQICEARALEVATADISERLSLKKKSRRSSRKKSRGKSTT